MTSSKHLKARVRARMLKTGERYAAARRQVLAGSTAGTEVGSAAALPRPTAYRHLPGNVPAATALRILLTASGASDPATGLPWSEAMVFGGAGGIGIGVFSFLYEREDFASLFLGGRHLWHDDLAYLRAAAERFGAATVVREAGGKRGADAALAELLTAGKPLIAWVERGLLPHSREPDAQLGGGYHVVTVYEADSESVLVGDLADTPLTVPTDAFVAARARIAKQKNRLLALVGPPTPPSLSDLVTNGLAACRAGLAGAGAVSSARVNFTLAALERLASRMTAPSGKDAWVTVFPRGRRLWNGLTMLHDFVEHNGTGGGLCRPLFADFLREASERLGDATLADLAERYEVLGREWSALADAALPGATGAFAEARALLAERSETQASAGPAAVGERLKVHERLQALASAAAADFQMTEAGYADLRVELAARLRALHATEVAADEEIGRWLASRAAVRHM